MNFKDYEIIDFHTHPFPAYEYNICDHKSVVHMDVNTTRETMRDLGISKICGSVLRMDRQNCGEGFQFCRELNDFALELRDIYGEDFYIPGIQVDPHYVKESIDEIDRMSKKGVKLVGELVPWLMGWGHDYDCKEIGEIFEVAKEYGMIISLHSACEEVDAMDRLIKAHPDVTIVAAHPGEYGEFSRHMQRMEYSENYYLDLSGYGIFRHGLLRAALDKFGKERFLFGSDYPTCNPAMYLGGVLLDPLITDEEKEYIFSKNAKRLLGI